MQSSAKVRDAVAEDIPLLSELLHQLFSIENDFVVDSKKQIRGLELLLQDKGHSCIKVMELNDQVIGMVSAQLIISTAAGGTSAWIEDMIIRSEYRGRGYGQMLLKSIEQWCQEQGALRMQLCTDKLNKLAQLFYKKNNWHSTLLEVKHKYI